MVVLATPERRETSSTLTPPNPDLASNWSVAAKTAFRDRWGRPSSSPPTDAFGAFFFMT
jgi:hypothetical protein